MRIGGKYALKQLVKSEYVSVEHLLLSVRVYQRTADLGKTAVEIPFAPIPPRTSAFESFESGGSECRKGIPRMGYPFSGAADRTRTGTELPPADFKSAVSTIPPQRRRLPNHFSIVCGGSQEKPRRAGGLPCVGRVSCKGAIAVGSTTGSIRATVWSELEIRTIPYTFPAQRR